MMLSTLSRRFNRLASTAASRSRYRHQSATGHVYHVPYRLISSALLTGALTAYTYDTLSTSPPSLLLQTAYSDAVPSQPTAPPPFPTAPANAAVPLSRYAVADVVEKVLPSVVNIRRISTQSTRGIRSFFMSSSPSAPQVCVGSGFFIDEDGLIITNAHVVKPGISSHAQQYPHHNAPIDDNAIVSSASDEGEDDDDIIYVTLSNGDVYIGTLVALDETSDIALVKINCGAGTKTPAAQLGDSDAIKPGEFIVTVGSPLTLSNSVNFGIISTIRRQLYPPSLNNDLSNLPLPPPSPSASSLHAFMASTFPTLFQQTSAAAANVNAPTSPSGLTYLQLDVAINLGSSGGPCVSLDGNVIGICSMKLQGDVEGIAFAIPIRYANLVVNDLLKFGKVRRPYVGLTLISVTPQLFDDLLHDTSYRPPRWLESEMRATNSAQSLGLMVHHLNKDAPGHRAGLKAGDVVVQVDGQPTRTTSEFLAALSFKVQQDCTLTVRRAATGKTEQIVIKPEVLRATR